MKWVRLRLFSVCHHLHPVSYSSSSPWDPQGASRLTCRPAHMQNVKHSAKNLSRYIYETASLQWNLTCWTFQRSLFLVMGFHVCTDTYYRNCSSQFLTSFYNESAREDKCGTVCCIYTLYKGTWTKKEFFKPSELLHRHQKYFLGRQLTKFPLLNSGWWVSLPLLHYWPCWARVSQTRWACGRGWLCYCCCPIWSLNSPL